MNANSMLDLYKRVRQHSQTICEPLQTEDYVAQSMPDASPIRWHLAHTTWFFETFCLKQLPDYEPVHPAFEVLFNSYYNTVGEQFPRHRRGLLTRPTVREVWDYREQVDQAMLRLLARPDRETIVSDDVLRTGLNHEQQHQELMLTDLLHLFSCNPLHPVYRQDALPQSSAADALRWVEATKEQIQTIGYDPNLHGPFCFDNELPQHRVLLPTHAIANRLVTNGEYLQFIEDGGYRNPNHWLSAGWATVQAEGWNAPLYWQKRDEGWYQFTLAGLIPVDVDAPVCHISYFEADAYARWAGGRLPTEFEWEVAVRDSGSQLHDAFGSRWQWTSSDYAAYPKYNPPEGAIGEYNGKFMCGQKVLRGSSIATPDWHARLTYRNFFPPETRWQFSGIRLAKDL
ncbi:ergothioneine biosynthesis protein EgtB [Rhodopirellula sp. JC740]|uniref:Ergothioneine biosynthesis protein EgtB n=1 Tax=Rhodopirellula halodulae TaxID=2894198 RepID=A0ABS8NPM0_9BACT|nr:ergothioneine biosynthesis protein EgtB [Rhodopirellula sp. JC740]MCC9644411.1 ergothioneine biosynthesis protein EgtB [Rhodopirellula sp. JC740]